MAASNHCDFEGTAPNTKEGDRDIGDASLNYAGVILGWFDFWLKGIDNGITRDMPKVTSFVLGAGKWKTADTFPFPGTVNSRLFLSGEHANSRFGNGKLLFNAPSPQSVSEYVDDPIVPVPSLGGGICCVPVTEGAVDQRSIESRADVLVYTTDVLQHGIEVAGKISAHLFVSSDRKDTDFVATLVDVTPDGTAYIIQNGILRARWREGFRKPAFLSAGNVYELDVDMEATHSYFDVGHRIRLDVSSTSFPRWDRNLNTGGSNFDETEALVASNKIYAGGSRLSFLSLPIVNPQ